MGALVKTVHVIGYQFDSLPGHVTIHARGQGGSLRVAVARAVTHLLRDPAARAKRIEAFKISVQVIGDGASPKPD